MTVKLTYIGDEDVFIILGNIKSIIFQDDISLPRYEIEFPDDLHYNFYCDVWILKEVW